jgi:hypothetical protein
MGKILCFVRKKESGRKNETQVLGTIQKDITPIIW